MDSEPDIVPIETLGTIVRRGTAATPTRPATLGRLELVSHGEHLRQAADSLERAPSATQRELRAHTLGTTFRALARSEEHTSELQSQSNLVCRLLLEKKKKN